MFGTNDKSSSSPPNQNVDQQEERLAEDPNAKGPELPADTPTGESNAAVLDPTHEDPPPYHADQQKEPANDLNPTTGPELPDNALGGEPNAVPVRSWFDPKALDDIPYHVDLEDPNSVIRRAGERFYTCLSILTTVMLARLGRSRATTEKMVTNLMVVYVAYMDMVDDPAYHPKLWNMIEEQQRLQRLGQGLE